MNEVLQNYIYGFRSVLLMEETIALEKGTSALGFASLPEDQEAIWKLYSDTTPSEREDFPMNVGIFAIFLPYFCSLNVKHIFLHSD
jgi:hypothetical protein